MEVPIGMHWSSSTHWHTPSTDEDARYIGVSHDFRSARTDELVRVRSSGYSDKLLLVPWSLGTYLLLIMSRRSRLRVGSCAQLEGPACAKFDAKDSVLRSLRVKKVGSY